MGMTGRFSPWAGGGRAATVASVTGPACRTGRPHAPHSIGQKRCLVPSANRPLPPRHWALTRRRALTLPLLTFAVGAAAACNDSVPVPTAGASSAASGGAR